MDGFSTYTGLGETVFTLLPKQSTFRSKDDQMKYLGTSKKNIDWTRKVKSDHPWGKMALEKDDFGLIRSDSRLALQGNFEWQDIVAQYWIWWKKENVTTLRARAK